MRIRYAIIEDNHFAKQHLRSIVAKLRPDWELVFTSDSVSDTVENLRRAPELDLIFMDVELADGRCFAIFEQEPTTVPVIFTTAYDEFAVRAFRVNSLGYILKPVEEKEMSHAIEKFEFLSSRQAHPESEAPDECPATLESPVQAEGDAPRRAVKRILIASGDTYDYINPEDVAYFTSEDNYLYAFLKNGRRRIININQLSKLEEILQDSDFFRLSRNVITSIHSIASVHKYPRGRLKVTVRAADAEVEVYVSAQRRDEFLRWFGN